jgi:hypothetical protein
LKLLIIAANELYGKSSHIGKILSHIAKVLVQSQTFTAYSLLIATVIQVSNAAYKLCQPLVLIGLTGQNF